MKTANFRRNAFALFSILVLSSTVAFGRSQTSDPRALVVDLYKQHDAKKSPFFQTEDRSRLDKYFVKSLADLIWKDANDSAGEVGVIDGDPLYDAQDTEIKAFAIGKAVTKGSSATVPVTFRNFGKRVKITFALKQSRGDWKIDNIVYSSGSGNLRAWFKK